MTVPSDDKYAKFADLRADVARAGGQVILLPSHIIAYFPGDRERLVVTFDNRAALNHEARPTIWGDALLKDKKWGRLGVMSLEPNWFRCEQLYAALEDLAANTLVPAYDNFGIYANSMGGYAALTFAGLFPNAITVTANPQTTLDEDIAPFETRFRMNKRLGDWTGRYVDGLDGARTAQKNYVFYDPMVKPDKLHALRLAGDNTELFPCPWMGHPFITIALTIKFWKPAVLASLEGKIDRAAFYHSFRARRQTPRYMQELLQGAVNRNHPRLARHALDSFIARGHPDADGALAKILEPSAT